MKHLILIAILLLLPVVCFAVAFRKKGRKSKPGKPEAGTGTDAAAAAAELMPDTGPSPVSSRHEDTIRQVYSRLEEYFRTEKPYLDGGLTVESVARHLFTNKLYVSKAVRKYSGLNFCQYVNRYRIRYSMDLFCRNLALRMSELAAMSGFNAVASFNISFRAFMNESPGDWSRKYRERLMSENGR